MADLRELPYDHQDVVTLQRMEEEEYVADDCVCNKETCDECNPGEGGAIERPNEVFTDTLKKEIIGQCHDNINACWNGWNMGCTFEDANTAQYYMELMALTQQFQKRVTNLKKKNN